MNKDELYQKFFERIRQGRKFEAWEREQWNNELNSARKTEVWTKWKGKGGRVDICLNIEEDDGGIMRQKATTSVSAHGQMLAGRLRVWMSTRSG